MVAIKGLDFLDRADSTWVETIMIFPRRHWAIRVIRRAGFPVHSREERLLTDILMRASRENPKELPTAEQVLFAALRMFHSQSAVNKVAESLAVSPLAAERALAKLPNAAVAIAAQRKMEQFIQVANQIHFQ
jgi:hypothetical protein